MNVFDTCSYAVRLPVAGAADKDHFKARVWGNGTFCSVDRDPDISSKGIEHAPGVLAPYIAALLLLHPAQQCDLPSWIRRVHHAGSHATYWVRVEEFEGVI